MQQIQRAGGQERATGQGIRRGARRRNGYFVVFINVDDDDDTVDF